MDFDNLHQILRTLYTEMMPMCGNMTGVARSIAGLGALFYVAYRVWGSLARAEPIDVYPLLRPFAIGICIMFFPTIVLGTMNGVLSPITVGTHQMLQDQTFDMNQCREQRDKLEYESYKRNPEKAYLVDEEEFDRQLKKLGITDVSDKLGMYIERSSYNAKKWIQTFIMNVLELIFQAAALVIDVIRTFFLVVLSILGPIAFAFSVWDGFHSSLVQWITRYITVYLWLPVSDLFSCVLARIQVLMLKSDIVMLEQNAEYSIDSTNAVYIVFMIIGIIGYFTIPTVSEWIVQSGMSGSSKGLNTAAVKGGAIAGGLAGAGAGKAVSGGRAMGGMAMNAGRKILGKLKKSTD